MKSNADTENRFLGSISASSIRNLLPRSVSSKHKMNFIRTKSRFNSENMPPPDPNIQADTFPPIPKPSPSKPSISQKHVVRLEGSKEISPPPFSDPPVKVVMRIRPLDSCERGVDQVVRKVSDNSLMVGDRTFAFDSVLDCNSSQVLSVACCVFYSHCGNRAILREKSFGRKDSGWFSFWKTQEGSIWLSRFIRMNELKDQVCSSWFAPVGSASDYPLLSKWVIYGEFSSNGGPSDEISPIYSLWATFIGLYMANYVVERSTGWALSHPLSVKECEKLKDQQMKPDFLDMVPLVFRLIKEYGTVTKQDFLLNIDSNQLEVTEHVDEIYQYYWVMEVNTKDEDLEDWKDKTEDLEDSNINKLLVS